MRVFYHTDYFGTLFEKCPRNSWITSLAISDNHSHWNISAFCILASSTGELNVKVGIFK